MDLKEYQKAREEFRKNSKKIVTEEFKNFFDKYPEVDALRWNQYTPYFNDGDECVFGRNDFDVRIKSVTSKPEVGDEELVASTRIDEDGFYRGWDIEPQTKLGKALRSLDKTFEDTDELFKDAFGDGVQITATRKGFSVVDYDHD